MVQASPRSRFSAPPNAVLEQVPPQIIDRPLSYALENVREGTITIKPSLGTLCPAAGWFPCTLTIGKTHFTVLSRGTNVPRSPSGSKVEITSSETRHTNRETSLAPLRLVTITGISWSQNGDAVLAMEPTEVERLRAVLATPTA